MPVRVVVADDGGALPPSQRRLQRDPDFTGGKLSSFTEVALRHGLPGALLGAACLLIPQMREFLLAGLAPVVVEPGRYVAAAIVIFVAMNAYALVIDKSWAPEQAGWIVYLGLLSVWEEWVFRLAIPYYTQHLGADLMVGVIASNVVFGAAHYFTLRWKWQWCLGAIIGGIALSRQMDQHFDLMFIAGIHWIATYLNTPRSPGRSRAVRGEDRETHVS